MTWAKGVPPVSQYLCLASKDAAEGEGFLLAHVYDANRGASHLAIMDAQNVAAGPLAKAYLDHRIPYGFHGNWRNGDSR